MRQAKMWFRRLLFPPKWLLCVVPPASFAALLLIFAAGLTECAAAYPIYCMSAYSLTVLLASLPRLAARMKQGKEALFARSRIIRKVSASAFGNKYLHDPTFRGSIGIYQGMIVNFLYMLFRFVTGLRYASVWFLSMAAYYLVLGALRAYLAVSYRRAGKNRDLFYEYRCYRRTAGLLFLLNIPMGGMIVLMVVQNSGYFYPGYVIYLSALYTFYTAVMSAVNLIKF